MEEELILRAAVVVVSLALLLSYCALFFFAALSFAERADGAQQKGEQNAGDKANSPKKI